MYSKARYYSIGSLVPVCQRVAVEQITTSQHESGSVMSRILTVQQMNFISRNEMHLFHITLFLADFTSV